jgi:hypothetical protein
MAIADGVDASQNVRLDYSNTTITIIQGVDVGQNTRMTVSEGVDLSQNVRLDFSNTRMTIIEGVDVGQNTNISTVTALAQAAFNRANTEPDSQNYLANTVIVANSAGWLSNSNAFFTSSNNTFITTASFRVANTTPSTNTTTGALVVQGGVGISGALNATTKSFNIPHPTKEGKDLRYGSLEGPEFGVYVRGTLKGSNVIELPEYWTKLVDANTITISLTSIGKYQKLSVKEVKDNTIIINSDGWFKKEIHCYYVVYGERADVDKLDVEG